MIRSNFAALENLFLTLSDGTRLRLLALMANGEVSVGYLADKLGVSQPKVSRHLAYMREAGIVSPRREGKWIYYGIETQPDVGVSHVLAAALDAMRPGTAFNGKADTIEQRQHQCDPDTCANTDISEWAPAEMDVFLL